ncbi:AsnC family transcriptional regulator [Actinomadura luteofluorescens]|uniref:AsnC family transcriptional regulator n=1 Tax=Actinomadura luteofluorescens TaxID=46163 RepID=UPI003639FD0B
MDSATLGGTSLGELDLQLLHALHLDGRAPFSRIAEVLGVSDRTAARRFARLRAARRPGHGRPRQPRLRPRRVARPAPRATPAAADLARELARRPDTAWVTVLSSGTEIVFIVRAPAGRAAPLAGLARHPRILGVEAHRLLRHLMEHRWPGRTSALTGEQVAALRPAPGGVAAPIALNDLDRGCSPSWPPTAGPPIRGWPSRVGWSESAVRRRLEELRRSGALRFDVEVDPVLLGFPAQCLIWLAVAPSRLASTARALAADPQAAFVGAVTGPHNLLVIAVCRDEDALYAYLSDRLGSLDGVERVETAPITSYAKRVAPPT